MFFPPLYVEHYLELVDGSVPIFSCSPLFLGNMIQFEAYLGSVLHNLIIIFCWIQICYTVIFIRLQFAFHHHHHHHHHHHREVQCLGQIPEVFQSILHHFVQREHVFSLMNMIILVDSQTNIQCSNPKKEKHGNQTKKIHQPLKQHPASSLRRFPQTKNKSDMEKKTPWKLNMGVSKNMGVSPKMDGF